MRGWFLVWGGVIASIFAIAKMRSNPAYRPGRLVHPLKNLIQKKQPKGTKKVCYTHKIDYFRTLYENNLLYNLQDYAALTEVLRCFLCHSKTKLMLTCRCLKTTHT